MTPRDITLLRLTAQCIAGSCRPPLSPLELVTYMGAFQAQDYAGALWSIGLRTGFTQSEILASIQNREIVRTWPQRGTLHFVPATDAKWHVALSAERLIKGAATRRQQLGLTDAVLSKSKTALSKALKAGKPLARSDVMLVLEKSGISTEGGSAYHILWYLSQTGVLVAGPMEGRQQTFTLLDSWIKKSNDLIREEGIAMLAGRYFVSHGPATLQDFMWWSGLTSADAKAGLKASAPTLECVTAEGREYWMKKGMKPDPKAQGAYLLPGFDEYMLGYKDRSAALHADHSNKIVPGGNGIFLPTIVIDGQVLGTWKKVVKKGAVTISLSPFKKLTKEQMQLLREPAERYGKFSGMPCVLV